MWRGGQGVGVSGDGGRSMPVVGREVQAVRKEEGTLSKWRYVCTSVHLWVAVHWALVSTAAGEKECEHCDGDGCVGRGEVTDRPCIGKLLFGGVEAAALRWQTWALVLAVPSGGPPSRPAQSLSIKLGFTAESTSRDYGAESRDNAGHQALGSLDYAGSG